MKTRLLMVVISLLTVSTAFGQSKFNLSGIVMEKGSNEPIMSATVQVCTTKDTTLVNGAATDVKGVFKINGVKKDKYLLKISFIGYHNHVVAIDLTKEKKKDVDLGYFTLTTDAIMLKEAEVTANAAKVQVKGDSLIYNADAYRMHEGSMLEDLVKKLPGATIEDDGTIKINGKEVKKVLVDGKEFFINDKNIALKNLPTNIIDRIKAYDRKSDLSRITGIDDGEDETVLDLTVKKGMNNGWFGQINGGLGTEHRYNARANVNRFNGSNQYSLVSSANNVSDRGFGGGGGRGFGGRGFGGGGGLQASKELGFNFASELSEKLEAGGYVWHRYNGSDSWNQSTTQNFVMPSGAFSNSVNQSYSSNSSLSSGFRFEWKPDSMWNVIFRPNFSYSRNRSSQFGESRTYDVDPNNYSDATLEKAERNFISHVYETGDAYIDTLISKIVNTNDSRSQNYSNSVGGNGELQINRKLNNEGRNITLRLTGGLT
ncbi:MAG: carboxypeptidase-like regulatory domain-containing protein, partial [Bacteroidaceae bacterium]|nr:carboxypeptidase-like regulatory domain-containing protein [Bacteroidaceae bacterium]